MTRSLITGGAGFVGTNLADRLLRAGEEVVVLDDLSRNGVTSNLDWLERHHGDRLIVQVGDVRDAVTVRRSLAGVDQVFHFAAQVAVTTSVADPVDDFTVNLGGTLTLLEGMRRLASPPPILFTSTNKVYGCLEDVAVEQRAGRYEPNDARLRTHGVGEDRRLDFASPYGCSKGGADQYVLDYARSFGLRTMVFRMSCIYGPHQQGNEDQGWLAHFLLSAMARRPITVYGDGRQVRDVLFVDDLLEAMLLAMGNAERLQGHAFNMGGGARSTVSLLELLDVVAGLVGHPPEVDFGAWRIADQRWYISDTRRFSEATGWSPKVGVAQGVDRLHDWLQSAGADLSVAEAI